MLDVAPGYHVMSDGPSAPIYVATRVVVDSSPGVGAGDALYPAPASFVFADRTITTFAGAVELKVPLDVAPEAALGARLLRGTLRYQACTATRCLFPVSRTFEVAVVIALARIRNCAMRVEGVPSDRAIPVEGQSLARAFAGYALKRRIDVAAELRCVNLADWYAGNRRIRIELKRMQPNRYLPVEARKRTIEAGNSDVAPRADDVAPDVDSHPQCFTFYTRKSQPVENDAPLIVTPLMRTVCGPGTSGRRGLNSKPSRLTVARPVISLPSSVMRTVSVRTGRAKSAEIPVPGPTMPVGRRLVT